MSFYSLYYNIGEKDIGPMSVFNLIQAFIFFLKKDKNKSSRTTSDVEQPVTYQKNSRPDDRKSVISSRPLQLNV